MLEKRELKLYMTKCIETNFPLILFWLLHITLIFLQHALAVICNTYTATHTHFTLDI